MRVINQCAVCVVSLVFSCVAQSGFAQGESAAGERVKGLEPFVGFWEGDSPEEGGGRVALSCRWVGNQSYLQLQISSQVEGERQIMGTLLIGKDNASSELTMWGFWPEQQVSGKVELSDNAASWTETGTLPDGGKASAEVVMKVEGDELKVDVTKVKRGETDGPEMHIVFQRSERRGRGGR